MREVANDPFLLGKGMGDVAVVVTAADPGSQAHDLVEPPRGGALLALLRQPYPRLAKELLRPLLAVLASARSICDGDSQKSEILLLIAMRSVEHPDFVKLSYETIAAGEAPVYRSLGTNIRSIADSAGIPRETVRRKVAELAAAGLVIRDGNALSLAPAASLAIGPLRDCLLRLAAANFELVSTLVRPPAGEGHGRGGENAE